MERLGVRTFRLQALVVLFAVVAAAGALLPADRAAAQDLLEVRFLDVGQADATLLQAGGTSILIDQGDWRRSDVVAHLQAAGVETLTLSITTHPHADHIGQFDQVLDAFEVEEVWWSGATTTTQTFGRALDALEASDVVYEEPRAGDTTTVGPFDIEIVNPGPDANFNNVHDSGLAFRITYGQLRLLFTGDAETATEARMVDRNAAWLDADILQVGHHGSSTSTSATFLEAVDPAVAIYSAGAGNQFGHPHAEVIDRLDTAGVTTLGTDVNGTVTLTSDGTTVTVTPQSGAAFSFTVDGSPVNGDTPFSDIAGTTHEAAILAIVEADITGGFPDGTYRPGAQVTRGQMAAFLTRALGLPAWQPPGQDDGELVCVDLNTADVDLLQEIVHIGPQRAQDIVAERPWSAVNELDAIDGIGPARLQDILDEGLASVACDTTHSGGGGDGVPFSDISSTTHEAAILAIVQADITGGFPDGTYRPGAQVTRGQMAAFLNRALDLDAGTTTFPDTIGTTHQDAIAAVADANITGGFPDGTYRPGAQVTRGQMAAFLARALNLL